MENGGDVNVFFPATFLCTSRMSAAAFDVFDWNQLMVAQEVLIGGLTRLFSSVCW